MVTSNAWIWVAAFFTLGIYTFPFGDNPVFRFCESCFVGTAAGYMVTANWFNYIKPSLTKLTTGENYLLIIPFIVGLLIYTRYIRSISWLSRIAIAFTLGYGSGFILSVDFKPLFVTQVIATFKDLTTGAITPIDNVLLVLGVCVSMIYFFFTVEHKGAVGAAARAGRWVMMLALGAAFGSTVMARVSLFMGRVQFLLTDWLFLIK